LAADSSGSHRRLPSVQQSIRRPKYVGPIGRGILSPTPIKCGDLLWGVIVFGVFGCETSWAESSTQTYNASHFIGGSLIMISSRLSPAIRFFFFFFFFFQLRASRRGNATNWRARQNAQRQRWEIAALQQSRSDSRFRRSPGVDGPPHSPPPANVRPDAAAAVKPRPPPAPFFFRNILGSFVSRHGGSHLNFATTPRQRVPDITGQT